MTARQRAGAAPGSRSIARAAVVVVLAGFGLGGAGCGEPGGAARAAQAPGPAAPATPAERMLAMLPPGAQVVIELDLARLRANPVVGEVVTRALADDTDADRRALPEGVPGAQLARAEQVVLAAYGVGTAQAATLTVLAAPQPPGDAVALGDGFYAVGPPDWVDQIQQRVALAGTGEARFALAADPELLALRGRAMPERAPGASLRLTARLAFDARIALARQTGLDAAPAQVSAWADVVDDLAMIVDCDASDPGDRARAGDATRRLEAELRGALAAVSAQPAVRALGLPSALASAKLVARGSWVRMIVAIGPARLRRVVERAAAQLRQVLRAPADPPIHAERTEASDEASGAGAAPRRDLREAMPQHLRRDPRRDPRGDLS